ncbi:MAG: substrate-binding domain-containing protein, partial [Bauldia sp.]|nr:substrate-binding domain-containing protein [Bauldia sp.]
EELNYVPDQAGRSLRQGTTNMVGFMMETSPETGSYGSDFFTGVFDGVQTVVVRNRMDLLVLLCSQSEDPDDYLRRVVARRFVDGLILSSTRRTDPRIDLLIERKIPFVTLGRSGSGDGYPWIDLDFEGVAETAVDRFVRNGHHRIAIATAVRDRNFGYVFVDAYRTALARHGIAFDPGIVFREELNERGGYHLGEMLLAQTDRPSAVLLVDELMAIGLYQKMADAGLRVGKDLAVVGFRDSPRSQHLSPSLTRYRTLARDLGVRLGKVLLAEMSGRDPASEAVGEIWPMDLIVGESG